MTPNTTNAETPMQYLPHAAAAARMPTDELRAHFLAAGLFQPGAVTLRPVDLDRVVLGSAVPLAERHRAAEDHAVEVDRAQRDRARLEQAGDEEVRPQLVGVHARRGGGVGEVVHRVPWVSCLSSRAERGT